MTKRNDPSKAVMEVWQVLLRFRWQFVIPAFIVMVAVLGVSMLLPRKYHAEAIFDRRTDMVLTEMRNAPTSFQDPRQSILEQLSGAPAIESLRVTLDPILDRQTGPKPVDRDDFYRSLNHRVIVRYDVQNAAHDRVRVEYTGSDPVVSRLVVNSLVQNYIDKQRAEMDQRLASSADFFRSQVQRFRNMIEESENQRLDFEMRYDSLLPDNPNSVQTLLADLRVKSGEVDQRRDSALSTQQALEEELGQTPETAPQIVKGRNPDKIRLQEKVGQAESDLNHSLNVLKMTERHPDLVSQRQHLAALRAELDRTPDEIVTETQTARNPKRDELELRLAIARADCSALEIQSRSLAAQIEQLSAQAGQLHPVRADYRKITREVDEAQRRLNVWEENLWRIEMARTAESGNRGVQLDFIKPCPAIRKPVSPALAQVIAAALALGLLAGALCVFFAHHTDETISDGDELVSRFNLPLFGCVSEIISQQAQRMRHLRNLIVYPVNATVMSAVILTMAIMLYRDLERPSPVEALPSPSQASPAPAQRPAVDTQPAVAPRMDDEPARKLDPLAMSQE